LLLSLSVQELPLVKRLVRKIWEFPIVILMFRSFVLFLILACGIAPLAAKAEIRIALVVGNGSYSTVSSLDNPARDAKLMANTLKRLGFEVFLLVNSNQADLRLGISQFGRDLRNAGRDAKGLFYYAGHGVQQGYILNWEATFPLSYWKVWRTVYETHRVKSSRTTYN
jgi:hypothetical protein